MRSAKKHWCSRTHHLILRSQERCIQCISVRLTDWSEQRFLPARLNLLPESSFHQQCHVSCATLKPSNIAFNSNNAPDFCIFLFIFCCILSHAQNFAAKTKRNKVFTEKMVNLHLQKKSVLSQGNSAFWLRTTENYSELMCKPSRLLSLWINVSIIFSGQINEAEEWGMNGKKKEKKPHVNSPGKRYSLLHYLRESRYLTDNLYSHGLALTSV